MGTIVVMSSACSGCLGESSTLNNNGDDTGADAGTDPTADDGGTDPTAPACTVFGKSHIGLGSEELAATNNVVAYSDRARAKPYSALLTDYERVLGTANNPASLNGLGGTFGDPPERWYIEPMASAVFVNTAYNVAFEGCLRLTGDIDGGTADPRFATAPVDASANTVCGEWMGAFWNREGTPDQIHECVSAALEATTETYGGGSIAEVTRPTTPKRQWAYACASVLSSSGFLTY
jgi:hypothetical protein